MKRNLVAVYGGHDANVTFYNAEKNTYHVIEIERLVKKRYFRLHVENDYDTIRDILIRCRDIADTQLGIANDYECVLIGSDDRFWKLDGSGWIQPQQLLLEVFNTEKIETLISHHHCHATNVFYQSPFDESLVISYDGGGDDGFFKVYHATRDNVKLIDSIKSDFGGGYLLCASLIREVSEKSGHQLALAGKMMGLCGYGKVIDEHVPAFSEFFFDRDYQKLAKSTGFPFKNIDDPWKNPMDNWIFEGQDGYDIASTSQRAFEDAFMGVLSKYDKKLPLCLTGGAALNVLVNQRIIDECDREVFVSPNPNDCGLSLGHLFQYTKPKEQVKVAYSGLPLLDRDLLNDYIEKYNAVKVDKKQIAKLIKQGNIIGFVYGDSEVGPRALGNRSIVCDPNIREMKDILNSKVKFREWYRPFAPFCKKEDASTYFESNTFDNFEFMSFAPKVKKEYVDKLPSITHIDDTARLQVVTEKSHNHFYELLTEFGKISETNVLLNTSFNIRGYPILSTIEDALYALNNTEMDYVIIEDYMFEKLDS